MTGRTMLDAHLEVLEKTRRDLMAANLELAEATSAAQKHMRAAQAETSRVTALFESCIPPPSDEWGEGSPEFRLGWDTCRQKMVELLRRPR
jgi:hypothetical protein